MILYHKFHYLICAEVRVEFHCDQFNRFQEMFKAHFSLVLRCLVVLLQVVVLKEGGSLDLRIIIPVF